MSALRWWAERVGRPGVVGTNAAHGIGERRYVTNEDRSAVLDPEKLARVTDPHVAMSLRLQEAFGLRREEAIKFTPAYADRGDRVRIKASWTKGGRAREIPIRNEHQRAVLDAARLLAGGGALIPGGRNYVGQRKVYERIETGRFERIDEPLFPPLATREALANAICHRDYSIGGGSVGLAIYDDRLEITSTGTLHFGLTPEKLFLPHELIPWNPLIADCFYRRGIIERWGRGTLKMAETVAAAGLPRPEIEDAGGAVTVRFRHHASPARVTGRLRIPGIGDAGVKVANLNEAQRTIFDLLLQAKHPLALREIRAELPESVSLRQVKRALARLKELALASSTGHGVSARWRAGGEQ